MAENEQEKTTGDLKKKKETLYISGGINGVPGWEKKFLEAEMLYHERYDVISPRMAKLEADAYYTSQGKTPALRDYFGFDLFLLLREADVILMLDGTDYINHPGCVIEHNIAKYLGLPIYYGEIPNEQDEIRREEGGTKGKAAKG